jgi:hypothetical protein
MKTFTIVPKMFEGSDWSGSITLRPASFDERFQYMEDMSIEISPDGEVKMPESNTKTVRKMVKLSQAHYVKVEIENKKTGEKITSFDDLQYEQDLAPVLVEVAVAVVRGGRLGND